MTCEEKDLRIRTPGGMRWRVACTSLPDAYYILYIYIYICICICILFFFFWWDAGVYELKDFQVEAVRKLRARQKAASEEEEGEHLSRSKRKGAPTNPMNCLGVPMMPHHALFSHSR